jgi:ABC-type Na+ efflux pump permease subunit
MRSRALFGCFAVFSLVLALYAPNSSAQAVFGSVIGTVTDAQGNAVAGAKVTVTSISKSTVYETTSNDSGNYAVTHLIPDQYKIHVEATGFKSYDVASVAVSADSSVNVDAALQVGAITQSVEVTGEIPQLKTDRADVDIDSSLAKGLGGLKARRSGGKRFGL